MKQKLKLPLIIISLLAFAAILVFAVIVQKNPAKDYREVAQRSYRIFSPECPSAVDFAGERMPQIGRAHV